MIKPVTKAQATAVANAYYDLTTLNEICGDYPTAYVAAEMDELITQARRSMNMLAKAFPTLNLKEVNIEQQDTD